MIKLPYDPLKYAYHQYFCENWLRDAMKALEHLQDEDNAIEWQARDMLLRHTQALMLLTDDDQLRIEITRRLDALDI